MPTTRTLFLTLHSRSWLEWITLIVSLMLIGGYIVWSIVTEHRDVELRERDRLSTQARVIDLNVAQQLDAIRRVLVSIRDELPHWREQSDGMSSANQRLTSFCDVLIGVRSLGIFDTDGTLVATNRLSLLNQNFRERDYFQIALRNQNPNTLHISAPFVSATGNWLIMVSMSLESDKGQFGGLIVAALDPDRFRTTLDSVNYTKDMWSAIAHGDGLQFMMVPERLHQSGIDLNQPGSFFRRHQESGKIENVLSGIVYSTGEHRMMALRTIRPPELHMDKPLVVAVGRDYNTIFERWRRDAEIRALLFLLLSITASYALYKLQRAQRNAEREALAAAIAIDEKNRALQALNEQLRSLALIDGLTGIANRRRFDEMLDHEWRRGRRDMMPLSLLMIDIDHFKEFNDHYGHQAGDECLREVAQLIKNGLERGADLAARYGGEEFVCLLPETDLAGATTIAESIRAKIEDLNIQHEYSTVSSHVTVSIGAASITPTKGVEQDSLIALADEALYIAKRSGRNIVK